MRTTRLVMIWQSIHASLWFVPGLMVLGAVILALGLVEMSPAVNDDLLARYPRIFGAGAESSRSILAAIATSMITVAGVTFSITILAVAQASAQFTPRILRNFMDDRANQLVLGTFVGVFVYAVVVLRTVRGGAEDRLVFIPSVAVLVGIVLALAAIGALIFFIHHIAESLQASSIVARASQQTVDAVDRTYTEELTDQAQDEDAEELHRLAALRWSPVPVARSGYIQHVDRDGLVRLATRHDLVIRQEHAVGEFIIAGTPIVSVTGRAVDERLVEAIDGLVAIASYRTVYQDPAFGIRRMVDIALKALSPGVNDTTTAVTCVDYLGAVLVRLGSRRLHTPVIRDGGAARLLPSPLGFGTLVDIAYSEIRRSAAGNVSVMLQMLRALESVATATRSPERRRDVERHVELIERLARRSIPEPVDRQRVEAVAGEVRHVLRGGDDAAAGRDLVVERPVA